MELNARLTGDKDRDEAVRLIRCLGNDEMAKKCWEKLTDYGKRSLVETTFSRFFKECCVKDFFLKNSVHSPWKYG